MEANKADPERDKNDPDATWEEADPPSPSWLHASWRGMNAGFRWASYIVAPFVALSLIFGLVLIEFGLGAGRGFGVPDFVLKTLGAYVVWAAWGGVTGAVVGLIGSLVGRGRPGSIRSSWWKSANRPIRLFGRRADSTPSVRAVTVPSRSLRRLWPFWLGLPVQLLMTGAFLAGVYLDRQVNRRLTNAIATADEGDPYWRLDDLLAHRDPVPYEENSAIVVAEALELLPDAWPDVPQPPAEMASPRATAASRAYKRMSTIPANVRPDEATAEILRHELDHYREALQIARTLMSYDRGRHELEIGSTVMDTRLAETQATRGVVRLLAADAKIRADDGDLDGALDSCRALLGAGRSIGDEPFLISQLVRFAIDRVAMDATRRVLGQGEPSDRALGRLQALISDEFGQPLLLHGSRGERAALVEMIRRVRDGELPLSALSSEPRPHSPFGIEGRITPWGQLMYDNQMALALEWWNQAVDIASRPTAEHPALWLVWQAEVDRVRRTRHGPFMASLPVLATPAILSGSSAYSRCQAELGATIILLAAERHRRRSGTWPASIEQIDAEILPSPPFDPFSGQPYRMEHRDGRLFIYSIGPNRQDEHGAYDPKQSAKGRLDDFGAIGWDVDRRRQPAPEGDAEPPED
jgi:hypothetical protein